MRIGLIQTRGIGDIIIALPIADFFIEQGCEVFWPIDEKFVPAFRRVKPEVNFIAVSAGEGSFFDTPERLLRDANCERVIPLYSHLKERPVQNEYLARSLKFDEYKYAIAGVPFTRKWDLRLRRDHQREAALHKSLGITGPYICTHLKGSRYRVNVALPPSMVGGCQVIDITDRTDSPFDWIYTLEHAEKLVMVDSCFCNLVEQLNIDVKKYLIFASEVRFTPVLKNGWNYIQAKGTTE